MKHPYIHVIDEDNGYGGRHMKINAYFNTLASSTPRLANKTRLQLATWVLIFHACVAYYMLCV